MPEHETQATALLPLDAETQKQLSLHGLEVNSDGYIDWAKNSPSHPRNWSVCRKAYDIGLIIFLDFFTTGISAGGTPASTFALDDFHIGSTLGIFAFASIYLVGQGLGGLLFSPYSETFGRRALYMWSALFYSLFCILVAAAPNIGAVFAGRFITGFLSAIPSVIVSGSIEDLFDTEAQIWMFFAWSVIVNLSLVIGPLLAFYIANALNWTWIFYISAIALLVTTLALLLIRESRPSHSLTKRVSALRKAHPEISLPTPPSSATPSLRHFITMSLIRPPLLFFTDPIVAITSVLSAVVFALICLLTAALPLIYSSFGLSPKNSMLILLFVGVGLVSSAGTRFYDRHVARTYRRLNRPLTPEAKLTGFVIAAPVLAGSLWIFAWTIPPLVHSASWIISALALILLGYATNEFDTVLAGYLADSYTRTPHRHSHRWPSSAPS